MIEVALVIAIAGLIFLIIFVAVPWLRATQRDAERREDLIYFIEEVKNFQRKNRGTLPGGQEGTISWSDTANPDTVTPTSWAGFYRDYLKEDFTDPDGENYKLEIKNCNANVVGKVCDEETLDGSSSSSQRHPKTRRNLHRAKWWHRLRQQQITLLFY